LKGDPGLAPSISVCQWGYAEIELIESSPCTNFYLVCWLQVEVGAEPEVEEPPRPVAPNLPVTVQKTNRVDVTDRFGKFEIRQELERKFITLLTSCPITI
jgi:hypothetical protein